MKLRLLFVISLFFILITSKPAFSWNGWYKATVKHDDSEKRFRGMSKNENKAIDEAFSSCELSNKTSSNKCYLDNIKYNGKVKNFEKKRKVDIEKKIVENYNVYFLCLNNSKLHPGYVRVEKYSQFYSQNCLNKIFADQHKSLYLKISEKKTRISSFNGGGVGLLSTKFMYAYEINEIFESSLNSYNFSKHFVPKNNEEEAKRVADAKKKKEEEAKRVADAKKKKEEEAKRVADAKKKKEQSQEELFVIGSGSGFFVSSNGYAVSNDHVVGICKKVATKIKGKIFYFNIISTDQKNDLGLIKSDYENRNYLNIKTSGAEYGEDIVAFGFPLSDDLSSSIKLTRGIVSSLSGPGNNFSEIQIDAAIQPGNSGGPVINMQGQVVGVASSGLNKLFVLEKSEYIPENVNFAIAAPTLANFLKANGVEVSSKSYRVKDTKHLAKIGRPSTLQLFCLNTKSEYQKIKKQQKHNDVLLDKVFELK